MKMLEALLSELAAFEDIEYSLQKNKGINLIRGCIDSQKTHLIYGLSRKFHNRIIVTGDELKAKRILEEYRFFGEPCYYYPPKDFLFYKADVRGNVIARERMAAVKSLLEGEEGTIITTIDGFFDELPSLSYLRSERIRICPGDILDIRQLSERLIKIGYERCAQVESGGQFALRGGILDVFSYTDETPVRIEFWDDEVDSLRSFDAETQRSLGNLKDVTIYPYPSVEKDVNEKVTFIDYFDSDNSVFFLDEPNRLKERAEFIQNEYAESVENRVAKGYMTPEEVEKMEDFPKVAAAFAKRHTAALATIDAMREDWRIEKSFSLEVRSGGTYKGDFELLISDLEKSMKKGARVILMCGSRSRGKRLSEDLRDFGLNAFYLEDKNRVINSGEIGVTYGKIFQGYEYPSIGFMVISESDIFGREQKKKKRYKGGARIRSFDDLKVGDYVVHESHGVGIYRGIEKINVDKTVKDYLKVEYAKGGNLYIPATGLELLQKYSGGSETPKLNTLGTAQWEKTKKKTRAAVDEVAQELVDLYALRDAKKGFAFGKDTVWQQEFEELFEYDETEDQLAAIADTKRDMESTRIMDRLICGDVGFGKTEIAIRAAFKAVQENKQVAILVPTTILAEQHYRTFCQRMKEFPVNVELLCRFRTPKEQKQTIEKLKSGRADIVIGTHRLLSKDVAFKDLGLLIVDEEQRFGVSHKEKIKQLKTDVDVLTLSATPIPRTLNMSLIGIRDMSILEEAPVDRIPIQTYVMEYNEETVREAINRELGRGGQVYFVYNRVDNIADMAGFISKLVPEASVAFAHGQMSERELEDVMMEFIQGNTDVLVATTIVENGIDLPNANTMIIYDADKMGLSQLYQLRGRIGRSNRTSYAFLMYRKNKMLKEQAEKRLSAIREFSQLGGGYRVALRDLELRGAGNLLGKRQSGHMAAIGYDLYCKMLGEAVGALKGDAPKENYETAVDLAVSAYIPGSYIDNEFQKLSVYKQISQIESEEDYSDMLDELTDRYGDLPQEVINLMEIARIKALAHSLQLIEISQKGEVYRFVFYDKAKLDPANLPELIREAKGDLTVKTGKTPVLIYKRRSLLKNGEEESPFDVADKVLKGIKTLIPD